MLTVTDRLVFDMARHACAPPAPSCRRSATSHGGLWAGLALALLILLLAGGGAAQTVELPAVCKPGSGTYLNDTDLWDGDLVPTIAVEVDFDLTVWGRQGSLFQDYVVSASSAESCCTQCWLQPGERITAEPSRAGAGAGRAQLQAGCTSQARLPTPVVPQTAGPSLSPAQAPVMSGCLAPRAAAT